MDRFSFGWLISVIAGLILIAANTGVAFGEPLVMCGNHAKPPKNYSDEAGNPKGILIDMLRNIEKEMKADFEILLEPWNRCYSTGLKGERALFGLSKTVERLELFDFSEVMFYDEMRLVVKRGKEFPFGTMKDLRGKRIGVIRGTSFGEDFEQGKKSIFTAVAINVSIMRYRMLLRDRIDAFLIGPGRAGFMAVLKTDAKMLAQRDQFIILPKPFNLDPNYFAILKKAGNNEFFMRFNAALKKGKESGAFRKIIRAYE